jgi:hypothetical protein
MYTKNKKWLVLAILVLICTSGYGQVRRGYSRTPFNFTEGLSVTGSVGPNLFFGDLVDEGRIGYSAGILVNREMSPLISARVQLMGGVMQGTQIHQAELAIPPGSTPTSGHSYANFNNMYFEFTAGATYRPLNHILGYFKERTFQPYALAQMGLIYYNASEYWGTAHEDPGLSNPVNSVPGEKWRTATGIAPIVGAGGGASLWLTPKLSANLEIAGTLAFTDELDAHDVWYSRYPIRDENDINDTEPYDFYYTVTVGITYLIMDSPYRNEPRFNRRSYMKTRSFFQPKSRTRTTRPGGSQRRWLFF